MTSPTPAQLLQKKANQSQQDATNMRSDEETEAERLAKLRSSEHDQDESLGNCFVPQCGLPADRTVPVQVMGTNVSAEMPVCKPHGIALDQVAAEAAQVVAETLLAPNGLCHVCGLPVGVREEGKVYDDKAGTDFETFYEHMDDVEIVEHERCRMACRVLTDNGTKPGKQRRSVQV